MRLLRGQSRAWVSSRDHWGPAYDFTPFTGRFLIPAMAVLSCMREIDLWGTFCDRTWDTGIGKGTFGDSWRKMSTEDTGKGWNGVCPELRQEGDH